MKKKKNKEEMCQFGICNITIKKKRERERILALNIYFFHKIIILREYKFYLFDVNISLKIF